MKHGKVIFPAVAASAVLAIALVCGWNYLRDNRLPAFTASTELYVYPDTKAEDVLDSLKARGVMKWPSRMAKVFDKHQVGSMIKPGHYVVEEGSAAVYLARMLNNCWQTPVRLSLSGTLRRKGDIARKISNQMMVDSASVHAALNDPALLSEFGFTPENVFALLMPDTYEVFWTAAPREILAVNHKAYNAFWTEENKKKAAAQGLTQMEVSILASIVSGETNYVPEMPKIAGVYLNRLHKGMKLQADPTVAFCYDYQVNRILRKMLSYDSPYNTYLHFGLPPGPIYVPTRNSLDAVLNPDSGNGNLYFCADPSFNGSHRFARTYPEHMRNARAFQKALNLRRKSK